MKVPHECEAVFLKPISGAVYVVYCWNTRIQTQLQQKQKQWSKFIHLTAARLAQLGERRSAEREAVGSNPGRTNTQGL